MAGQLAGKVAIVTGGTKGIGAACTKLFLQKGAKVVFTSRRQQEGAELERELREEGFEAAYVNCDVTRASDIEHVIERTVGMYGQIDILVNNAATHISKLMHEYTLDDFDTLIHTNLRNYFLHAKYAVPHLRQTKGSIVNIGSSTGKVGQYAGSLYAATKGGIMAFTKSAALDYARVPIRVNAILPAYVDTPLLRQWIDQQPNPAEVVEQLGNMHALGRISSSLEIAAVAAFLASDEASTVTGAIIDADGGATLEYSPAAIRFRD
ncbi:MAG: short-chain dehydrogenase/reductase [Paenibacillus sp.]|nr:short-chain dehydrogenase/reductase [Paenibacillus sp.]